MMLDKLIGNGYQPIPCNGKKPISSGWQADDLDFNKPPPPYWEGTNIGIRTGQGDIPIYAIDLDIYDESVCQSLLKSVKEAFGESPIRTGNAPKQMLFYRGKAGHKKLQREWKDPSGNSHRIEILGHGQQFIAEGIRPDTQKPYSWDNPIGNLMAKELTFVEHSDIQGWLNTRTVPENWVETSNNSLPNQAKNITTERWCIGAANDDEKQQIASALKSLDPSMPYDNWLKIGMALHNAYDGSDEGLMLFDKWSAKSDKYKSGEPSKKWHSFSNDTKGSKISFRTIFKMAIDNGWENSTPNSPISIAPLGATKKEIDALVEDLNNQFILADISANSPRLISRRYDEALRCEVTQYQCLSSMKELMKRETIWDVKYMYGKKTVVPVPILEVWIKHQNSRIYKGGVTFNPKGNTPPDMYNLWNGYSIKPLDGSCETITSFLKEVICSNNEEHYQYLINWLARAIQKPGEVGEVALVLQGKRGVGKTTIGEMMRRIFGNNYILIDSPDLLTRNFNSHLRECVFAVADESVFAGDRKANEKLKNQITSGTMNLELKGVDIKIVPSYLTLVIISNSEHIIATAEDERRYFALEVSDCHMQDTEYFKALYQAINGDEMCRFFNMMMEMDLFQFDHRAVPTTQALANQKALSLEPFDQWLCDAGYDGSFSGQGKWEAHKATYQLVNSFEFYFDTKKLDKYQRLNNQRNGKRLRSRMFTKGRRRIKNIDGFTSNDTKAVSCYELGTLHDFRNKLIDKLKLPPDFFTDGEMGEEGDKNGVSEACDVINNGFENEEEFLRWVMNVTALSKEEARDQLNELGGDIKRIAVALEKTTGVKKSTIKSSERIAESLECLATLLEKRKHLKTSAPN